MKNKLLGLLILLIGLVTLSIVLFVISIEKTTAFWISYGFFIFAFAIQIIIWVVAIGKSEKLKIKFLGVPVIQLGFSYLFFQVLSTFIFRFIVVENWISIITSVVLLGIPTIVMLAVLITKNVVTEIDDKIEEKSYFINNLKIDVELMINSESNVDIKEKLVKLYDAIRFSDPISAFEVQDVETQITNLISSFKESNNKMGIIDEIDKLLIERNMKIKALK